MYFNFCITHWPPPPPQSPSEEAEIPGPLHILFFLPGMLNDHPQLYDYLIQIHQSCLISITSSENPPVSPSPKLSYFVRTPIHKFHSSFKDPAQFIIMYLVMYLFDV